MKTFGIQFSNYNFKSQVLFVEALSEEEAVKKVKDFVAPQRFEYERTLSDNEVNRYSEEEKCFATF